MTTPVDWDLLADHLGGALTGADEDRVAHLVATDPEWTEAAQRLSGALDAVTADLQGLPPPALPAEVATRLDDTLRTASHHHAASPEPVPSPRGGSRPPADSRAPRRPPVRPSRRRFRPAVRWAAGLAAAAAVAVFAATGLDQWLPGADDGDPGVVTADRGDRGHQEGPEAAPDGGSPRLLASGTDYQRSALPATPPRESPAVGPRSMSEPSDPPRLSESTNNPDTAASGDQGSQEAPAGESPPPVVDPALRALWETPGTCLARVREGYLPDEVTVLAVDFARFEGEPALLVWLTTTGGDAWITVAGPDCGSPDGGADERYRTAG